MIELEIYAAGVRDLKIILELDHALETMPGLHYKIDRNHDIVYFEIEEPAKVIAKDLLNIFHRLGLEPRVVGQVPPEMEKKKTQVLR
jgi:hypothetical protein